MTVMKSDPTAPAGGGALTPEQQQAMAAFAAAGSAGTGAGRVFMGGAKTALYGPTVTQGFGDPAPGASIRGSKGFTPWMSTTDAQKQFYHWDEKKRADFIAQATVAGLMPQGAGQLEAVGVWTNLVNQAANYAAAGAQVTPFDILSTYIKGSGGDWVKDGSGNFETNVRTGEKRYVGPQFETTHQTRVDLTDPQTARAIATKIYQDLLGRNPGKGEIAGFATALSSAEGASPQQATTTTQYDMTTGKQINSNTVTAGGVSEDAKALLAQDQAKANPEYGAVQAATTYANALESAVYGARR